MATPQQAITAIANKIATQLSATRASSDFLLDVESFNPGDTKFQIRKAIAGKPGESNTELDEMALQILVHHRLADPNDELAYGDGNLLTYSQRLLTSTFYSDLPEVFEVTIEPELDLSDITRVGNIISFTVTLAVTVQA